MYTTSDKDKSRIITDKVSQWMIDLLGKEKSFFHKREDCRMVDGELCTYYVSINQPSGNEVVLHEMIITQKDQAVISFNWIMREKEDKHWHVLNAEKNGVQMKPEFFFNEIVEVWERLQQSGAEGLNIFEVPSHHRNVIGAYIPSIKKNYADLFPLIGAAILVAGLFVSLFVSSLQYYRITRIVDRLDEAIFYSTETNGKAISSITKNLNGIVTELDFLKEDVQREAEAFQFSKLNTANDIRRQAKRQDSYTKVKAYELIATKIETAGSYGELIFQISRLPNTTSEAQTLLAIETRKIVTLDRYAPVFKSLGFPVSIEGHKNSAKSFIVTSDFDDMRMIDPYGGDGTMVPHQAIDLVNFNSVYLGMNTPTVDEKSKTSGLVVAAEDGVITRFGYDNIFGWRMEISHPVSDEVKRLFPDMTSWSTFYAHMKSKTQWKVGDRIKKGDKISNVGNTGYSTGTHLHFEVRIYSPKGYARGKFGTFYRVPSFTLQEDYK